jgi:hypothetical protein
LKKIAIFPPKIAKNCQKSPKVAKNCQKLPKITENRQKLPKIADNCHHNIELRSRNMDSLPGTPHTIASYCDPHSPIAGSLPSHRTTPLASMGYGGSGGPSGSSGVMATNAEMCEEQDLHLPYEQA